MEKLSSIGKLEWLRNKIQSQKKEGTIEVHVCMTGCRAYGAASVREAIEEEVKNQGLAKEVEVRSTGCHGMCAKAPVIAIEPMINCGTKRVVTDLDEWTIRTADRGLSAHFEHTVAVTAERLHEAGGHTIVTQLEKQSLARRRRHIARRYKCAQSSQPNPRGNL